MRTTNTCHDLPCLHPPPTLWLLPRRSSKPYSPQSAKWLFIAFSPSILSSARNEDSGLLRILCPILPQEAQKNSISDLNLKGKQLIQSQPESLASWSSNNHPRGPKSRLVCFSLFLIFSHLFSQISPEFLFPSPNKHKANSYQPVQRSIGYRGQWAGEAMWFTH